jgi:hypothetical protein
MIKSAAIGADIWEFVNPEMEVVSKLQEPPFPTASNINPGQMSATFLS